MALADEDVALSVALEETQCGFVQVDSEWNLPRGDTVTTVVPPVPRCECLRVGRIAARAQHARARSELGCQTSKNNRGNTDNGTSTYHPPARPTRPNETEKCQWGSVERSLGAER